MQTKVRNEELDVVHKPRPSKTTAAEQPGQKTQMLYEENNNRGGEIWVQQSGNKRRRGSERRGALWRLAAKLSLFFQ